MKIFYKLIKKLTIMGIGIKLIILLNTVSFAQQELIISPFINTSKYKGKWNIGKGIAKLFADEMEKNKNFNIYFQEPYQIQRKIFSNEPNKKFVITGTVREFNISSYGVIFPGFGGYNSYSAEVEINLKLRDCMSNSAEEIFNSNKKLTDRNIGLTIFGGPGTSDETSGDILERLHKLKFGSNEFKKTLIGKAVMECIYDLQMKTEKRLSSKVLITNTSFIPAKILSMEGDLIYLNISIKHNLKVGEKFVVYTKDKPIKDLVTGKILGYTDKKIGIIKIELIKSESLFGATIINKTEIFKEGLEINLKK